MTIEQTLDIIAPQFSTNPDRAGYIEIAKTRVSASVYGTKYELAVAYRVAHDMTINGEVTGSNGLSYGGIVTEETEGDLSRSFADTSSKATKYSSLLSTSYGQSLYDLMQGNVIKALVVT